VIVLSLLLVLTSAGLLLAGMIRWLNGASTAHTEPLVWASLVVGVLAVLLVAWAVARRRGAAVESDGANGSADASGEPVGWGSGSGHPPVGSAGPAGPAEPWSTPSAPAPDSGHFQQPAESPADGYGQQPPGAPDGLGGLPTPPDEPSVEVADPRDSARLDQAGDVRVLVVDGRPRYHLASCPHLIGRSVVEVSRADARAAGFTPCGQCRPESELARLRP